MSRCTLILLALVLTLLVGVYALHKSPRYQSRESVLVLLGRKDWALADRIDVYLGDKGQGLKMQRTPRGWVIITKYEKPANKVLVKEFLANLARLRGEERVCQKDLLARFSLTPKKALHIVLYRKGKLLGHLLIGKRGPTWQSVFVREFSSPCVYLVWSNLLARFDIWKEVPDVPKEKEFVDLKVLDVPLKGLKSLKFSGTLPDHKRWFWKIYRQKGSFFYLTPSRKTRLSASEAEKFLRRLFPLYAESLVEPRDFPSPTAQVIFQSQLGRQVQIEFGPCGGKRGERVCKVRKGPYVYEVREELLRPFWQGLQGPGD